MHCIAWMRPLSQETGLKHMCSGHVFLFPQARGGVLGNTEQLQESLAALVPSQSRPDSRRDSPTPEAPQMSSSRDEQAYKTQPAQLVQRFQLLEPPPCYQKVLGSRHYLRFCSSFGPLFCVCCLVFILKTGFLCIAPASLRFLILCLSLPVARITGR